MEILLLVGRIMFAMIFIGSGIGHLVDTASAIPVAEKRGFKNPAGLIRVAGVGLLLLGLSVALGIFMDIALLGIPVAVLFLGVTMHPFWKLEGAEKHTELGMFMKNLSIAGASLALFAFVTGTGYSSMTITGPLLSF